MKIQPQLRCILLWLILIITMILHFNYHIGELFYGIDVARENADGTVPIGTHLIRNVFYHLPIVWILLLMLTDAKIIRVGLFAIALLYTLSHLMHLIGEMKNPDLSQGPLLFVTLLVSILLCKEHFKYLKSN